MYGRDLADAIMERKEERVKELLQKGANLTFTVRGDNPLHLAARFGLLKCVRYLLRHGDDANRLNENHNTALHFAAKEGREDIVKYLLKHGADINLQNKDGDTALHVAVGKQPMDVIERFIHLGMDVNRQNNRGETPLHHAVQYSRDESVEALLLSGADPSIKDYTGKRADQIATNAALGEMIRTYNLLKTAMDSGYIRSEGMCISHKEVTEPKLIKRVELTIEKIDLPTDFPTTFYCRREFSENTTVKFTKDADEEIISDVFILRVRDVFRDLNAKLTVPVYAQPSDRQLMCVKFLMGRGSKTIVTDIFDIDEKTYCHVDAVLVPETTTAIVLVVEPKSEVAEVGEEAHVLNSSINPDFELDIPMGAFGQNTVISLKVFGSETGGNESNTEEDDGDDDHVHDARDPDSVQDGQDTSNKEVSEMSDSLRDRLGEPPEEGEAVDEASGEADKENIGSRRKRKKSRKKKQRKRKSNLLSDVYEINISGEQPAKSIKMQIPLNDGCTNLDVSNIQMVRVDSVQDTEESPIQALDLSPELVDNNIVFNADHFSMWAASIKIDSVTEMMKTFDDIERAKERVQEGQFFVMLKLTEEETGKHVLLVECVKSASCRKRRHRWHEKGFVRQKPRESKMLQLKPSQEYCIKLEGDARFDARMGETGTRKLLFSPHRASFQPYQICLTPMYKTGKAEVLIYPVTDNQGMRGDELTPAEEEPEAIARLPIQLQLPPSEEVFGPEIEEAFTWLSTLERELVREKSRDDGSDSDSSTITTLSHYVVPPNIPKRPSTAREARTFSKGELYPSDILPRK